MNIKRLLLIFTFFISSHAYTQTYIQDVTIVDIVNLKLIPNQTVIIEKNTISNILAAKEVKIPTHTKVINGKDKFLMPGLIDAHIHFFQSGGLYTRPDAIDFRKYRSYENEIKWTKDNMGDFLQRYIKAGITGVIDAGATHSLLSLRDSLAHEHSTPSVYMTGPLLTTYEPEVFKGLNKNEPFRLVENTDQARKYVQEQLAHKPDFIKIWFIVRPGMSAKNLEPIIRTIIEEARKHNLKTAVHATEAITAWMAVESGCDFLVHSVEDEVVSDDFVRLLKQKNVTVCPTLTVIDNYAKVFAQKTDFNPYELRYSNPEALGSLFDLRHLPDTNLIANMKLRFTSPAIIKYFAKGDSVRKENLKKLADGGVRIAAGTDAGNIGTHHAASYLRELAAMKESGMSNWQILESATINPVRIMDKENSLGSIEIGKIADLVLLEANPLEDLNNLTKVSKVFKNGREVNLDSLNTLTPEALVLQQVNAYNAGNLEAFLETYSEDIELYDFPDKLLGKGKQGMRRVYGELFQKYPELHCEIKGQIFQGETVILKESITGTGPETLSAIVIYQIENDKIAKVYFMNQ